MNDPNIPNQLTEGWPDDPSKADVEAFARELQGKLPELPAAALQRIGGMMHDEMVLQRWRKRRRRWIAVVGVAASVFILIGIWRILDPSEQAAHVNNQIAQVKLPAVRDQYRVPVMPTPALPPVDSVSLLPLEDQKRIERSTLKSNDNQPLIALENHRNLFTNE